MYAVTGITGQVGKVVAETLRAQGHDVRAVVREPGKARPWVARGCELAVEGMRNPTPRLRMLDGFNEGWIEFEAGHAGSTKGHVGIDAAVATLAREG